MEAINRDSWSIEEVWQAGKKMAARTQLPYTTLSRQPQGEKERPLCSILPHLPCMRPADDAGRKTSKQFTHENNCVPHAFFLNRGRSKNEPLRRGSTSGLLLHSGRVGSTLPSPASLSLNATETPEPGPLNTDSNLGADLGCSATSSLGLGCGGSQERQRRNSE